MKLALALTCALTTAALAGPDVTKQRQADALFDAGQASYQKGEFQRAIDQFKQAYELVRDPVYLFNIAQSYRKVGDCESAHENYTKYLDESPKAQNRDKVNQWIRELQPCVDERARERDEAARRAAEEAERKQREQQLSPTPAPAEPVEREVDNGKLFRIGGYVLTGVGVVGLIAGISYGVKGDNIKADIAARCSPPNTCQWDSMEIQALHADGQSANTWTKVGYIGGSLALVTGVVLYAVGRSRVETVMVVPEQGGASVSARLSF